MRNIVGVPNGNFNNLYLNLLICTALLINQMTHTLAEIHKMHYVVTLNTPNISFHIGTEIEHLALNLCVQTVWSEAPTLPTATPCHGPPPSPCSARLTWPTGRGCHVQAPSCPWPGQACTSPILPSCLIQALSDLGGVMIPLEVGDTILGDNTSMCTFTSWPPLCFHTHSHGHLLHALTPPPSPCPHRCYPRSELLPLLLIAYVGQPAPTHEEAAHHLLALLHLLPGDQLVPLNVPVATLQSSWLDLSEINENLFTL